MGDKNKKDLDDYSRILQEEESITEENVPKDDDTTQTQVNDAYVKSLGEKIESTEDTGESLSPYKQVKHKFVAFKKEERKGAEDTGSAGAEGHVGKEGIKRVKPRFPFSEKTTQKLEEEIKKDSSRDSEPPPTMFRAEPASWHGNSIYVLCGPDAGKSFYITGNTIKIGRALENDVVLKDISVSRKHCTITHEANEWFVQDLGSDNGTYVDGKPVRKLKIRPGQYLQLGRTILIIESA